MSPVSGGQRDALIWPVQRQSEMGAAAHRRGLGKSISENSARSAPGFPPDLPSFPEPLWGIAGWTKDSKEPGLPLWRPETGPGKHEDPLAALQSPTPHHNRLTEMWQPPRSTISLLLPEYFWKYFYSFSLEISWLHVAGLTYNWLLIYQQLS